MNRYPLANWRGISVNTGGPIGPIHGALLHVQQGRGSLFRYFNSASSQVSAHFWIGASGIVEQYVTTNLRAWHAKAANRNWIGIETEGTDREPLTDAQVRSAAALVAWLHTTHGVALNVANTVTERGLGTHAMGGVAWGAHACPGKERSSQRQRIIDLATVAGSAVTVKHWGEILVSYSQLVTLDEQGNGWFFSIAPADQIVSILCQGSYPPADGYWPLPVGGAQQREDGDHKSVVTLVSGAPNSTVTATVWVV